MIVKNYMKAVIVGAVAAAMPVISNASSHYTGKTPPSIAMLQAEGITPPAGLAVSTTASHKMHKKLTKKVSLKAKHHKKHAKHKKVLTKKKHTVI